MNQQTSSQAEPLIVHPSKKSFGFLALGASIFVVIGIGFVTTGSTMYGTAMNSIGYTSLIFFGFCLLYALTRLIFERPSLRIDDEGIYDNASAVGAGLVRWEEIKDLPIYTYGEQSYLGIVLYDVDEFIRKQPFLKRRIFKLNKWMPGLPTPFNIPAGLVQVSLEEVQERAVVYLEKARGKRKQF
ncbi:hypothetical protein JOC54_003077 [Alkalihalobacillus xiaoxiensis]|uniref:Uncharacterized protein n=1 Tax=Shouchella xiaoxiensis TaxID=766895 RepID=A0ABS2SW98_9BACI|nr:STM3941 family protein [Shouchella xiaoxiensis]MBM7839797.1 hypothetical protein [Shouchella xiaoxiensis]